MLTVSTTTICALPQAYSTSAARVALVHLWKFGVCLSKDVITYPLTIAPIPCPCNVKINGPIIFTMASYQAIESMISN